MVRAVLTMAGLSSGRPGRPVLAAVVVLACCVVLVAASCKTASKQQMSQGLAPPPSTTDAERLGDQYMANNMAQAAIPQFEQALAAGASKASVAWRIGNAYFSLKKWPEALEAFRQAIAADPRLAVAYEGAGYASFELGRFEEAVMFFEQATELAPAHWVPHAFLAVLYRLDGNRDQAMAEKETTLTLAGEANKLMASDTIRRALNRALALRDKAALPPPEDAAVQDLALLEAPDRPRTQTAGRDQPAASGASAVPDDILDPLSPDMDILGLGDQSGGQSDDRPGRTQTRRQERGRDSGGETPSSITGQAGARDALPPAAVSANATPPHDIAPPSTARNTADDTRAKEFSANATNATAARQDANATAARQDANATAARQDANATPADVQYVISTPLLSPGAAKAQAAKAQAEAKQAEARQAEARQAEVKQAEAKLPGKESDPGNRTAVTAPTAAEGPARQDSAPAFEARNASASAESVASSNGTSRRTGSLPAQPGPGEPFVYSLLESSWKSRDRAVERANYLRLRGVRAQLMEADLGPKGLHYRVMIGSRQQKGAIEAIKKELDARFGLHGLVILRIRPGSLEE
ncbi:hypothetical protein DGI_3437 [Megalodesulfovibrio gigas DSM 1382 = ATCC 19364]|uniref:Uncharacterized protein n=2 Tax=Megalodesulfovibrio gigas TaxID=879 RepID=T2GGF8_MEGG1|nr:hypothetical protein DGI_3437 [Megalodesulfovibrio gigas DSM 1382 = ATCC 19364]